MKVRVCRTSRERMNINMDEKQKDINKKNAQTPEEKSPLKKPLGTEGEKDDFFDEKFEDIDFEDEPEEETVVDEDIETESEEDEEPVTLDDIDEEALKNFDIEKLILQMAKDNPSWGYLRIAGSLKNLGYKISKSTLFSANS